MKGDKWFDTGGQVSYVATSYSGLNFNGGDEVLTGLEGEPGTDRTGAGFGVKQTPIANAYLRTFIAYDTWYGFTNYGPILKGPGIEADPWQKTWTHEQWPSGVMAGGGNPVWMNLMENFSSVGADASRWHAGFDESEPSPFDENAPRTGAPRHFATRWREENRVLEVYYTARGESPEAIYMTTMDVSTSTDFRDWETDVLYPDPDSYIHQHILFAKKKWEGAGFSPTISKNGTEEDTNALRDPFVFTDINNKIYILYSGGPENAISICELVFQ